MAGATLRPRRGAVNRAFACEGDWDGPAGRGGEPAGAVAAPEVQPCPGNAATLGARCCIPLNPIAEMPLIFINETGGVKTHARHCERSEAIQHNRQLDCFVAP
jgi:hypothetical protein